MPDAEHAVLERVGAPLQPLDRRVAIPEVRVPDDGGTGDIGGFTIGSTTLSGSLRAKRSGGNSGRVYTLGYLGRDRAGNTAACGTTVEVPHDRSQQ